jgi:hypothetical protein
VTGDEAAHTVHRRLPGQRVYRAERDQHIAMGGGRVGYLLAGSAGCPVAVVASTVNTTAPSWRSR